MKRVKFGVSVHFLENAWREWPEILHADVSWPPSDLWVLGHGLLIFVILVLFWLSETGQIWGFRAFPGEHWGNGLKYGMLLYPDHQQNWLDYGYDLVIFRILVLFWLSETSQIWVSRHFLENPLRKWPDILHVDVSWPPSGLIRLWLQFVDFSNFYAILT